MTEVVPFKEVVTFSGPANRPETTAAAAIPPRICEQKRRMARMWVRAPMRYMPRVTAGLKRPHRVSVFISHLQVGNMTYHR